MACILKAPTEDGGGVVVFTTQERDQVIKREPAVEAAVRALKPRWLVGLHHNWHDTAFVYDPLFDFSMAGEDDLVETSGREVPLVTLDACNFVPDFFAGHAGDRFWDVLYIARPVFFKGFREFFSCVRALYDRGHMLRVLCISPVPPYVEADRETVLYELEDLYVEMFSDAERRRLNLLALRHDYPFPLDLETLAHFYRSSKVFTHFAADERRCRVAGYAWAAGLPVVAMEPVGSLLPQGLRRPPYFFEAESYDEFPGLILNALESGPVDDQAAASRVLTSQTVAVLEARLEADFGVTGDQGWAVAGLDIRLGRHHGLGPRPNAVPMRVERLVEALGDEDRVRAAVASGHDPEVALAEAEPPADPAPAPRRFAWPGRRGR
jgi:hypothetical protein